MLPSSEVARASTHDNLLVASFAAKNYRVTTETLRAIASMCKAAKCQDLCVPSGPFISVPCIANDMGAFLAQVVQRLLDYLFI